MEMSTHYTERETKLKPNTNANEMKKKSETNNVCRQIVINVVVVVVVVNVFDNDCIDLSKKKNYSIRLCGGRVSTAS